MIDHKQTNDSAKHFVAAEAEEDLGTEEAHRNARSAGEDMPQNAQQRGRRGRWYRGQRLVGEKTAAPPR